MFNSPSRTHGKLKCDLLLDFPSDHIQHTKTDDEKKEVYVANVPSFDVLPFHQFYKMFEACGKIQKYKLHRNKNSVFISFETEEAAKQAVTKLDRSFIHEDKMMFVSYRKGMSQYEDLFIFLRRCDWQSAYTLLKNNNYLLARMSNLYIIAQMYELIGCQHFDLFYIINQYISENQQFWQVYQRSTNSNFHIYEILMLRREGWFARKKMVCQFLCETTNFTDDVIHHVMLEYLF
jgi:hypothetical protein